MHPLLRAVPVGHLGLFTAADAHRADYDPAEIRRLCASGEWVRLRRGVYTTAADLVAADPDRRHRLDCLALLLQLDRPTAVLSHTSAARLWGLRTPREADPLLRLTDPAGWRRGKGFLVTCAPLEPAERWRAGPVRLTSAARTLVDCAREWGLEDAVVALDAALLARRTTTGELQDAVARARHWAGAPRARRAVALADGRAESPLETRGRLRLLGAGPAPTALQVEIHAGGRRVAVVDAWYEEAAVAVEFDGRVKYTDPWRDPGQVLWEEKRREDALRALDIRVARVVDADLDPPRWTAVAGHVRGLVSTPLSGPRRFVTVARAHGLRRPA